MEQHTAKCPYINLFIIGYLITLKSYGYYCTNSGLKYSGVPTLVPYTAISDVTILDTPKSPNCSNYNK